MPQPPAASHPLAVLVVDDNADAADSLAFLLGTHGYSVRTAGSGADALAAAGDGMPDAAVLDLRMPGMSGHELARTLRVMAGGRPLLLVAVTGLTRDEDRREAAASGVDAFLLKPADPADILARLAAFGHARTVTAS